MPKTSKKDKQSLLHQVLIYFSILVSVYLLLIFLIMPLYTRHWQRKQVPDVTFLSAAAAEKVIRSVDLVPKAGESKYNNFTPPGYVIFQNPAPNSLVKKGRRVYLVISKGKQLVAVPNFVGANLRDVRFMLMQYQLNLGKIVYEFDGYFPEGVIMNQSLEPDNEVAAGTVIDLTVSLGEEPVDFIVPNLIGRSSEEAELLIKKACLTLGKVSFSARENADDPKVIYQSLPAGTAAARGDTLNVVYSIMAEGQEENIPW